MKSNLLRRFSCALLRCDLDAAIPRAENFFDGFDAMEAQAFAQGVVVRGNPPAQLSWYFQTPLTYRKMPPCSPKWASQLSTNRNRRWKSAHCSATAI
jgi:hypothetical protein